MIIWILLGIIYYLFGVFLMAYLAARQFGELRADELALFIVTGWGWPIFMWALMDNIVVWRKK